MAFRRTSEPPRSIAQPDVSPPSIPSQPAVQDAPQQITSVRTLFCRLVWSFIGPVLLAIWTYQFVTGDRRHLVTVSLSFFVTLAATIAARWYSYRLGDRTDLAGELMTPQRLRWYTLTWLVGGFLLWLIAVFVSTIFRT